MGLQNPGREYVGTRHNVGGDVVLRLAERHRVSPKRERGLNAEVVEIPDGARRLAIAIPETYMNLSGEAVAPLVRRYVGGDPSRLVVIHDELDLEPGVVRVKVGGGTAGHNGLKSVHQHLGTLDFVRVRIGIGKPPGRTSGAGYVLDRPGKHERLELEVAIEVAADAVWTIFESGADVAMNSVNRT